MTTFAEAKAYARGQAHDAVGAKADRDIAAAVNGAVAMIARDRQWTWYQTLGEVSMVAPYSTGTIALVAGDATVTLTTGTWPSWAAYGKILYDGKWLRIASRTSDTEVELTAVWGGAAATAQTYVLYRDEYSLPTDCGRFGRLYPGTSWVWGGEPSSLEDVLAAYNGYSGSQTYPQMWALFKDKIIVWPYPSTAVQVNLLYYRLPAVVTIDATTMDWDPQQLDLLECAINHQLTKYFGTVVAGDAGTTRAMYQDALARAVKNEKVPAMRGSWFSSNGHDMPPNMVYAP
jgi:hypothetical protein